MKWLELGYSEGGMYKKIVPHFDGVDSRLYDGIYIRDFQDCFFSVSAYSEEMREIIGEDNIFKELDDAKRYLLHCVSEFLGKRIKIDFPLEELTMNKIRCGCSFHIGGNFHSDARTIDKAIEKLKIAKELLGGESKINLYDGDEPLINSIEVCFELNN